MKRLLGIIIEGSDCSGKTTLVNRLRLHLSPHGWYSLSVKHRHANQFERYLTDYLKHEQTIYDRAHFSEIVYGSIWRGSSGLSDWQKAFLHNFVLDNFIVVLAQAPSDILAKRYRARQEEQVINVSELEAVQNMFKKEMCDPRVIQYISQDDTSLDRVVDQIVTTLKSVLALKPQVKQDQQPLDYKRFILLEGSNGSGKYTLAKLLKINMLSWSTKTLDYRAGDHFMRYLREYSLNTEIIFDRGHISEVVYSQIFRDGQSFSAQELAYLNEYLANKGTLIFCNPPVAVIRERVSKAAYPKHIREDDLERVVSLFKNYLTTYQLPYWEVDTADNLAIDQLLQSMKAFYQTLAYSAMNWTSAR